MCIRDRAYGWSGLRIDDPAELDSGISAMLAQAGPVLVDVHVARFDNCYPMVPAGAGHHEMLFGPKDLAIPVSAEAGALV